MQHLQPNTTLQGGKYRIERVLGQGGFGITYLAVQTSLQRKVAIKEFFMKDFCSRDEAAFTMSAPSTGSNKLVEQYRKKFIKEARNLARLNHPNIISVIDVFEENGTVYYVMPYLLGGSLQDYVKAHGPLSESMAMKYVKQIAGALKYMHEEQHICHYDVKPANILLDDKGNAVLIDFGISKNYDTVGHETTTTPVGMSDGYAPIEQYQQNVEEFSPASDVYALGATLYFLLHGKRPVSAVQRASGTKLLMYKTLSQGVKDIINTSMKTSRIERTNSVDVFLKDYNHVLEKESNRTTTQRATIPDDEETIIVQPRSVMGNTTNPKAQMTTKKHFENGFEYVDLGLSVFWATINIGASSREKMGEGFIWGDCNGWIERKVQKSIFHRLWNYKPDVDVICGNNIYDTATNLWGSKWRMPTCSEFEELSTKGQWYLLDNNHVQIIGPNGNSIVLCRGEYWTGENMQAYSFNIKPDQIQYSILDFNHLNHLNTFCMIRPVMDKK